MNRIQKQSAQRIESVRNTYLGGNIFDVLKNDDFEQAKEQAGIVKRNLKRGLKKLEKTEVTPETQHLKELAITLFGICIEHLDGFINGKGESNAELYLTQGEKYIAEYERVMTDGV
ncbi:hypothetical protein [Virgibacillus necropolis]|uniref:Uncharacterized protein n=1 Tax=Virgibacillus necropolis TaxID=163877 RepID=A0A221MCG9_9BACI|nr:hypothetical protein [Virgibacillus necropolis]ASN05312.1 hypothetical protein CFK40_09950 [Virgibacillus necropolis]